jgi:hypothetical protein
MLDDKDVSPPHPPPAQPRTILRCQPLVNQAPAQRAMSHVRDRRRRHRAHHLPPRRSHPLPQRPPLPPLPPTRAIAPWSKP